MNDFCSLHSHDDVAAMTCFVALSNAAVLSEQVDDVLLGKSSTVYASVADIEAAAAAERKRMAAEKERQAEQAELAFQALLNVTKIATPG